MGIHYARMKWKSIYEWQVGVKEFQLGCLIERLVKIGGSAHPQQSTT